MALCNGFPMRKARVLRDGLIQVWRCLNKLCKASSMSDFNDYNHLTKTQEHRHTSTPINIEVVVIIFLNG